MGTGPLRLQQCRISWFEILVLEGTGVLCPRATRCQGAGVLAGGGMLSGGMRIAPHVSFSQKADSRAGLGSGKPASGRHGEAKGCARLLGPGLSVH